MMPLAAKRAVAAPKLPEHRTKSELVYEYLREQILSGNFEPGRRLTLQALAQELQTSHMPVREAAQRLAKDGLIQIAPHRDMRVTPVSARDAHEIFRIRAALEALAARTACERGGAEAAPALAQANAAFDSARRAGDLARMAEANWRFQRLILAAADNHHLAAMLEEIWGKCQRFRLGYKLIPGRAEATVREHARIVAAMRRADPAAAETAIFHHVDLARIDLERMLQQDRAK